MPKTIAQELDEARAQVAAITEAAASDAKASAEAMAKVVAEGQAMSVALADVTAKLDAETKAHEATKATVETMKATLEATQTALDEANKKLADPAYRMATSGSDTAVADGAPASAPALTRKQAEAEYASIPGNTLEGARARAEYRKQHKDILGL